MRKQLDKLNSLILWAEQSKEFKEFCSVLVDIAHNETQFPTVGKREYIQGASVSETALQNEFFRHFKEGLLFSTTLLDYAFALQQAELNKAIEAAKQSKFEDAFYESD
jgi:hypothetical protein